METFQEILKNSSDEIEDKLRKDENSGKIKYRHKDYCLIQQHSTLHQILKNAMYQVLELSEQ